MGIIAQPRLDRRLHKLRLLSSALLPLEAKPGLVALRSVVSLAHNLPGHLFLMEKVGNIEVKDTHA